MKPFVLVKVLQSIYFNSKNKTLSLSFYDTSKKGNRKGKASLAASLGEFEANVPDIYYNVDCAAGTKRLTVYSFDKLTNEFVTLSVQDNFEFEELLNLKIQDFSLYRYADYSNFSGGGLYEKGERYLKYDAALFVQIFRLLGETVNILFKSQGNIYHAHYIDGKVICSEISEHSYIVSITTLFQMNGRFPDYEIIDFNAYPFKLRQKQLLETIEKFCAVSGLKYSKELV